MKTKQTRRVINPCNDNEVHNGSTQREINQDSKHQNNKKTKNLKPKTHATAPHVVIF